MRYSAQIRDLECPLFDGSDESYDYLNSLITDNCPFSGRPLTFPTSSGDTAKTASLDRIDSSQGYVRGNVRWVHKVVNIMRKDMGDTKFLELVKDAAVQSGIIQQSTAGHTIPMKRLLICTIVRDVEKCLLDWAKNLEQLRFLLAAEGWQVDFSVYENDSIDLTSSISKSLLDGLGRRGSHIWFTSETLSTQRYSSVWSLDRLRNLAAARQRCLDQVGGLNDYSKIAYIEPDVTYSPIWASELVLAKHPKAAGIGEPDIYSGWSLRSERHPKESIFYLTPVPPVPAPPISLGISPTMVVALGAAIRWCRLDYPASRQIPSTEFGQRSIVFVSIMPSPSLMDYGGGISTNVSIPDRYKYREKMERSVSSMLIPALCANGFAPPVIRISSSIRIASSVTLNEDTIRQIEP